MIRHKQWFFGGYNGDDNFSGGDAVSHCGNLNGGFYQCQSLGLARQPIASAEVDPAGQSSSRALAAELASLARSGLSDLCGFDRKLSRASATAVRFEA